MLSARKKARFAFLSLPEDLQDEIVEGLDAQTLTLTEASALVKSRGHSLSHEGVAGYYRAVRMQRRLLEVNEGLTQIIAECASKPQKEALEGLVNLVIATAATGVVDGSVGIAKIDLAKLVRAMATKPPQPESAPSATATAADDKNIPDAEQIRKLREQFL
jgi:hypothetical protein